MHDAGAGRPAIEVVLDLEGDRWRQDLRIIQDQLERCVIAYHNSEHHDGPIDRCKLDFCRSSWLLSHQEFQHR